MNILLVPVCTTVLLVLAGSLPGQQDQPAPGLGIARQRCGLAANGDAAHAFGHDYKVDFTPNGVVFTPALGDCTPYNLPLSWSMQTVSRGATVHLQAGPTAPTVVGMTVDYRREGVVERYEVHDRGIEQSFVFDRRPAGDGDLVVRCRLDTELALRSDGDDSLLFERPAVGGVRIGHVVGIDANGDRCAGQARVVDGALELSLPGAFVDAARYPLVLDPPIGAVTTISTNDDAAENDVAYDRDWNRYYVVWVRRFSSSDSDIYGCLVNPDGTTAGTPISIDTVGGPARRPRVASVNASNRFLVTFDKSDVLLGPRNVRCTAVNASNGVRSSTVDIAATTDDEFGAVVAGDASTTGDNAIVAWESNAGIVARRVYVPSSGNPFLIGSEVVIASGPGTDHPAISKAAGSSSFRLSVAWSYPGPLARRIALQTIDRDLNLLGTPLTFGATSADCDHPAYDAGLLVFEQEAALPSDRDLRCATVTEGAMGATLLSGPVTLAGSAAFETAADVCKLGNRWAVIYTRANPALDDDVLTVLVNGDCTTCNAVVAMTSGSGFTRERAPRIASSTTFDDLSDGALAVWTEANVIVPTQGRLVAQPFANLGAGTSPVFVGGGCAPGATASTAGGACVVGNQSFMFQATGIPSAAIAFFALGFPGPGIACGGCTFTDPLSFEFIYHIGFATRAFGVPCSPGYVGLQLESQWVLFNTAGTACPAGLGVSASNRMRVTIGN